MGYFDYENFIDEVSSIKNLYNQVESSYYDEIENNYSITIPEVLQEEKELIEIEN